MTDIVAQKLDTLISIVKQMYSAGDRERKLGSDGTNRTDPFNLRQLKDFDSKLHRITESFNGINTATQKYKTTITDSVAELLTNKYNPYATVQKEINSLYKNFEKEKNKLLSGSDDAIKKFINELTDKLLDSDEKVNKEAHVRAVRNAKKMDSIISNIDKFKKKDNVDSKQLIQDLEYYIKTSTDDNSETRILLQSLLADIKAGKTDDNDGTLAKATKELVRLSDLLVTAVESANTTKEQTTVTANKPKLDDSKKFAEDVKTASLFIANAQYSGAAGRLKSGIGYGEELEFLGTAILDNIDMSEIRQMFTDYGSSIRGITGGKKENFNESFSGMSDGAQSLGIIDNEIPKFVGELNKGLAGFGISGKQATHAYDEFIELTRTMRGQYDVSVQEMIALTNKAGGSIDMLTAVDIKQNKGGKDRNKILQEELQSRIKLAKVMGLETDALLNSQSGKYQSVATTFSKSINTTVGIEMLKEAASGTGLMDSLTAAQEDAFNKAQTFGIGSLTTDAEREDYKKAQLYVGQTHKYLTDKGLTESTGGMPSELLLNMQIISEKLGTTMDLGDLDKQRSRIIGIYGESLKNSSGVMLKNMGAEEQTRTIIEAVNSGQLDIKADEFFRSTESKEQQTVDDLYVNVTGGIKGIFGGTLGGIFGDVLGHVVGRSLFRVISKNGGIFSSLSKLITGKMNITGNIANAGRTALTYGRNAMTAVGSRARPIIQAGRAAMAGRGAVALGSLAAATSYGGSVLGMAKNTAGAVMEKIPGAGAIAGAGGKLGLKAIPLLGAILGGGYEAVVEGDAEEYRKRLKGAGPLGDLVQYDSDDWNSTMMFKDMGAHLLGTIGEVANFASFGLVKEMSPWLNSILPESVSNFIGTGMFDDTKLLNTALTDDFKSNYGSLIDEDIAERINAMATGADVIDSRTGQIDQSKYQAKIIKILEETKDIHVNAIIDQKNKQIIDDVAATYEARIAKAMYDEKNAFLALSTGS